jgi:hypothetical protein
MSDSLPALSSLTAGPELDARVAIGVMGWRTVAFDTTYADGRREWTRDGVNQRGEAATIPRYSTSIEAAWQVVEKMRNAVPPRYQNLKLIAYCYNRTYACFDCHRWDDAMDPSWAEGNGVYSAPLAICRAALFVVEASNG